MKQNGFLKCRFRRCVW